MTYPTFDFYYDNAYTSKIEFDTQINSKELGREQRYPKRIYPVRTFTLSFNKNFDARQELEDFFAEVYGSYGYFNWVWQTDKGGNGETYLCWFEADEFLQKVSYFGASAFELNIKTIDRNAVSPPVNFDFYHDAKSDFTTKFYTLVDKIVTSQNTRRKMWNTPLKSWKLTFDKDGEGTQSVANFFIAKRGKFKAFQWTWETDRGGDGQTYWVRFDDDELIINQFQAFGRMEIKLQEVFAPIVVDDYDKDEIIPRKLIKIDIPGNVVRILDNETLEILEFNSENYMGAPLELSASEKNDNTEVARLNVSVSNVGQAISGILGQNGDIITGQDCYLYQVFLNTSTLELVAGTERLVFMGRVNNLHLTTQIASMDIECSLGGFTPQAPFMSFGVNCQYRKFKDIKCGYTGGQTTCDRTLTTCKRYGNVERFGGFPNLPSEQVIKAA